MKLFIASDLHGSARFTRQLLERFDREGDLLVLLGDLYYHGVRNPLPEGYAPLEVCELLNARRDRLLVVRGNCDADIDLTVSQFPVSDTAQLVFDGRRFYFCHGHKACFEALPPLVPGTVFCQGHTHISSLNEGAAGVTLLNPGSISLPKGGTPRGFATVTDGVVALETFGKPPSKRSDAAAEPLALETP